jgi:hypothetical protein
MGRKGGAYQWYEIQDTVDYWQGFEQTKIGSSPKRVGDFGPFFRFRGACR